MARCGPPNSFLNYGAWFDIIITFALFRVGKKPAWDWRHLGKKSAHMKWVSIWSVKEDERLWFKIVSLVLYVVGLILRIWVFRDWQWGFELLKDLITVGILAVTTAYFFVEAKDAMGAITEWVKARNLKKGLEKGRQEVRQQVEKWIADEEARGTRFQTPPPFNENGETPAQ